MAFDTTTDPTYTVGEFVYSWVPGIHWIPRDIETAGYATLKLGIVVSPAMAQAGYLYFFGNISAEVIAMHGGRWAASGYLATQQSWGFYRLITKPARVARTITHPALLVPGISVAGAHAVTTAYDRHVVQQAPEHHRSGFWDFFAAMLTGTGPSASYTDI